MIDTGYDVHYVKPLPTDESITEFIKRAKTRSNNDEWINSTIKFLKPLPTAVLSDDQLKKCFIQLVPSHFYLTDLIENNLI